MNIAFAELERADLHVDAIYEGGRFGNAGDDPLPRLLRVDSQGGFRKRGKVAGRLDMLVLTSSLNDPDWPDALDPDSGIFTYYGDNKKPGRDLHKTGRDGNLMLKRVFEASRSDHDARQEVPPIFVFGSTGTWRDVKFLGLAVPGASDLDMAEELVAIWRISEGQRFQNYRAQFTILNTGTISRKWIDSIIAGERNDGFAPDAWCQWLQTGRRNTLTAVRSLEYRTKLEQLPSDAEGEAMVQAIRDHFSSNSHGFEHCAAAIARFMMPDIAEIEVTRRSRDGGRDAIGKLQLGKGPGSILVDFALEAKCYGERNSVGVKDMSRLISRLRHRQFGVLVTTSFVDRQTYKEIKADQHPVIVITAADIIDLLRRHGRGSSVAVRSWLAEEFPA